MKYTQCDCASDSFSCRVVSFILSKLVEIILRFISLDYFKSQVFSVILGFWLSVVETTIRPAQQNGASLRPR